MPPVYRASNEAGESLSVGKLKHRSVLGWRVRRTAAVTPAPQDGRHASPDRRNNHADRIQTHTGVVLVRGAVPIPLTSSPSERFDLEQPEDPLHIRRVRPFYRAVKPERLLDPKVVRKAVPVGEKVQSVPCSLVLDG